MSPYLVALFVLFGLCLLVVIALLARASTVWLKSATGETTAGDGSQSGVRYVLSRKPMRKWKDVPTDFLSSKKD